MKTNVMRVAAITMLVCLLASVASADIMLNVAGTYGQPNCAVPTLHFDLPAGQWLAELVSPETDARASYWSWNPWNQGGNWSTYSWIMNDAANEIYEIGQWNGQSSAQAAFWDTIHNGSGRTIFTLQTDSHLRVGVCDGVCSDNQGGVSIRLTQIPEPATLSLLALGGLAMLRRRK